MITSEALMTATTSLPSWRSSSRAASTVIEATTRLPPTSSTTLAIAAPSSIAVTLPGSWLRALSFMARTLVERHDPHGLGREDRPCRAARAQAKALDLLGGALDDDLADAHPHAPALGPQPVD